MNISNSTKKWYVFYTYPKSERKVHEYLQGKNYESFLPLYWIVRQWSDRKKRMKVPLFSGYIFVNIEKDRIFEVLKTPKIVRCVTFNKIPASLRQSEVDNIIQITENDYPLEVSCDLKVGDPVVVSKGALIGMEGVLVEERGNQRFALRIESLNQSMLVNIPADHLEFADVAV